MDGATVCNTYSPVAQGKEWSCPDGPARPAHAVAINWPPQLIVSPSSTAYLSPHEAASSVKGAMSAPPEHVPAELRTPPLGLVALVGGAAFHAAVSAHLRSELRPPLHCISVTAVDAVAQLFPARKLKAEPAQVRRVSRDSVLFASSHTSPPADAFGWHPARQLADKTQTAPPRCGVRFL